MADPKNQETDATMVIKKREATEAGSGQPQESEEGPGLETVIAVPSKSASSGEETRAEVPAGSATGGAVDRDFRDDPPTLAAMKTNRRDESTTPDAAEINVPDEPVTEVIAGPPPLTPPESPRKSAPEVPPELPPEPLPKSRPAPPRESHVAMREDIPSAVPRVQQKTVPGKKGSKAPLVLAVILLLALGGVAVFYLGPSNLAQRLSAWLPFKGGTNQAQQSTQSVPAGSGETTPVSATVAGPTAQTPGVQTQPVQTQPVQTQPVQRQPVQPSSPMGVVQVSPASEPSHTSTSSASEMQAPPASADAGTSVPSGEVGFVQAESQQEWVLPAYDQVQTGMASAAVKSILGEPAEVKKVGRAIEWEYDTGTGFFEVRFLRDKVVFKAMTPYHIAKPAQTAPATTVPPASGQPGGGLPVGAAPAPSDFDRITVGMTSEAVMQILGKPAQVKKLRVSVEWEYETPQGTFDVRFRNNRVNFRGIDPESVKPGVSAPSGSSAPGAQGLPGPVPQRLSDPSSAHRVRKVELLAMQQARFL